MSATTLRSLVLASAVPLQAASCFSVTGRLANAYRAVTSAGPTAIAPCQWRFDVGSVVGSGISSTVSWQPATGTATGSRYVVLRRRETGPWSTISTQTGRSIRQTLTFGTAYRYATRTRTAGGSLGPVAYGQYVETTLYQEGTSLAKYSGSWTTTSSSTASGGKLRTSTQASAYVEFQRAGHGHGDHRASRTDERQGQGLRGWRPGLDDRPLSLDRAIACRALQPGVVNGRNPQDPGRPPRDCGAPPRGHRRVRDRPLAQKGRTATELGLPQDPRYVVIENGASSSGT
jgi:hypothetical protein